MKAVSQICAVILNAQIFLLPGTLGQNCLFSENISKSRDSGYFFPRISSFPTLFSKKYRRFPHCFIVNMSKRQRTSSTSFIPRAPKRPIDKSLVVINKTVGTSQLETTLETATFPCTITGLRWDLMSHSTLTTGNVVINWAIIIVKDGNSANTMATSDASSLYQPEQNVLAYGCGIFPDADAGQGPIGRTWTGNTKTMRKLMAGDKLALIALATGASAPLYGAVQFFCKT